CTWTERLSEGCLARQHRASLLLVPSHDHAWDAVHRPNGRCHVAEFTRTTRVESLVTLGSVTCVPLPLHRQYSWLDDRRTGTSTVVDLRTFSHAGRVQQGSE